jgi:surface antigen
MRASRVGAVFVVLLGCASYSAACSPAEARTEQRHGTRRQVAAAAMPAPVPGQARRSEGRNPSLAAPPSSRPRAVALLAPRGGATARDAATRGATTGSGGGISCVPFVRQATGMAISGNGRDWWHNAAGLYDRGDRPEVGAVLAFPASGGMRLGHVAVVSRVLSAREVLVDHANWAGPGIRRGTVMRGVSVIDVSPDNDWTQVRVQVGWTSGTYGRVYPTHGFIYNRPDPTGGTMLAGRSHGPRIASAAADGREMQRRGTPRWVELAEEPAIGASSPHARRHLDLSIRTLEAAAAR